MRYTLLCRRLELNVDVEIKSPHRCPINWLDIDESEGRYLLTAASDGSIALFDLDGSGDGKLMHYRLIEKQDHLLALQYTMYEL